eukprot:jgi/Mesvir1/23345/Mv21040-RA.1
MDLAISRVDDSSLKEVVAKGKSLSQQQFDGRLPLPSAEDVEADPVHLLRRITSESTGQIKPFIEEKTTSCGRVFHLLNFMRFLTERWNPGVSPSLVEAVKKAGGTVLKLGTQTYASHDVLLNMARAVPCHPADAEKRCALVNEWCKTKGVPCRLVVEEVSTDARVGGEMGIVREMLRRETAIRFEIQRLESVWARYNEAFKNYESDHRARESFPLLCKESNLAMRRLPLAKHELEVVMNVLGTPELLRTLDQVPVPPSYEYDPRMVMRSRNLLKL